MYRQVEQAAERYHEAEEQARQSRSRVRELDARLADQRRRLSHTRHEVGRVARQQYRDGGLALQAYLSVGREGLQKVFRYDHLLDRLYTQRRAALARLNSAAEAVRALGLNAQRTLRLAQRWAARQRAVKLEASRELQRLHALTESLTSTQSERIRELERKQADDGQRRFLTVHRPASGHRAPSRSGERAVAFAYQQLGKPYVWGAQGPSSYDCSGLTSQAWHHAGVPIPRTSQEQWKRLARIPLDALRPGDLVIYYREATHVAIYIGDGRVVHAPRPGALVKLSPIAFGQVLGAVRPDPEDPPLRQSSPSPDAPVSFSATAA
ncbi:C40 family peptidase [Streptomyces syringium]|uniref:C40 family peptidase n=1 Tax=Streptomyces syringium TaxID=76729 RepID=UPI0034244D9C